MRNRLRPMVAALVLVGAACGSESTGPTATYDSIAGSYSGFLVGVAQGVALEATFSLTIAQTGGDLSGSWALQGTLDDGFQLFGVQGTGTLNGSIGTGNNPSVNLVVRSGGCPNYQASFSGAYDSSNRRLTISGPVDILDGSCAVVLRYQSTIILNR